MSVVQPVSSDLQAPLEQHLQDARRVGRWAAAVVVLGMAPVAVWLAVAPLSAAVVASSFVKVDLDRRVVQHVEGGTVREVKVRDGQHVSQGQPLLVLGDVSVDADLNRLNYRVLVERAGLARLEAEQAWAGAVRFPTEVIEAAQQDTRLAEQLSKERSLFGARRDALVSQTLLLRAQQRKVVEEAAGLRAQIASATASLTYQTAEVETNRRLHQDGFISSTRISQLEAAIADYRVKLEEKRTDLARAEQRLVDADLRVKSLDGDYRQQASDQLKVSAAKLAELQQEQRKTTDASNRQVIVAPVAGDIVNLKFTTPGAVVSPREPIAEIVPTNPRLVMEAHIRTEDIGRVRQGQPAEIRFTAFKYRTTTLVTGRVFYVAPDRVVDRTTNQPYYVALVEAEPGSLAKSSEIKLQAGMPAEVYINGEVRTPLQYLTEPVTQVLRHAGRER